MRILTAVVEVATLPVFHAGQYLALRGTVALELVRNDYPRHVLQALQQLAKKLLRRLLIAPALHEDVKHVIVLVDSPPQVMPLTLNGKKYLIQVPLVARSRAPVTELIGVVLPKLPAPLTDSFIGYGDATLEQQFFHIAVAQGEAIIEPDAMADDLAGEAVVLVAFGVSGWRHVGCLF